MGAEARVEVVTAVEATVEVATEAVAMEEGQMAVLEAKVVMAVGAAMEAAAVATGARAEDGAELH